MYNYVCGHYCRPKIRRECVGVSACRLWHAYRQSGDAAIRCDGYFPFEIARTNVSLCRMLTDEADNTVDREILKKAVSDVFGEEKRLMGIAAVAPAHCATWAPDSLRISFPFMRDESNEKAYELMEILSEFPRATGVRFIYGPSGTGKTHLLKTIGTDRFQHFTQIRPARVYYTTYGAFEADYHQARKTASLTVFRNRFRSAKILMIDDLHEIALRDPEDNAAVEFIDLLYDQLLSPPMLILVSRLPINQTAAHHQKLLNAFNGFYVNKRAVKIEQPSEEFQTLLAGLRNKI